MISKPKIGVLAFSDGDPDAFELLKAVPARRLICSALSLPLGLRC